VCGRFTLTFDDPEEIARVLGVEASPSFRELYKPRYNVAPTDLHFVVRLESGRPEIVPAKWGLGTEKPQINTRAENARVRTMLHDPAAGHRCLVPADGFFEWTGEKGKRRPIWFHRSNGGLVYFAAMCAGTSELKFSILTTEANALVARVHDRMPAIVPVESAGRWLTTEDDREVARFLARPPDDVLIGTEVSPRVNAVANDDPACLAPPSPEPLPEPGKKGKQMRLF
jgi:putative SOS response-associated peptidase YedK